MNFSILSNGQISAGFLPHNILEAGGRVLGTKQDIASFEYTITAEDCDGADEVYILLSCHGICGAGGRYVHFAPSISGEIILYINSNSAEDTNNTILLLAKVSPGDTIKDNVKGNVSTYTFTRATVLYKLESTPQT